MVNFPKLSNALIMERLQPPADKVRMVLDTDTYNEIDDQFAVVHALLSPEKLVVEALYAAPFFNERAATPGEGMEKSHAELLRLLSRLGMEAEGLVHRGSDDFLGDNARPLHSPAVDDLIARAMASEDPLYVVAIGALTNIASAILIEPAIIEKIVVVWLGGTAFHWPHALEFNLLGDVEAARLVFDCGVPLVMVPCAGVTTHFRTSVPEIDLYVEGKGAIGDYLAETFKTYSTDHFGWSKEIWDMVAIAYMLDHRWMPSRIVSSPVIAQKTSGKVGIRTPNVWETQPLIWAFDPARHPIRYAYYVERDPIFRDFFMKLERWAQEN